MSQPSDETSPGTPRTAQGVPPAHRAAQIGAVAAVVAALIGAAAALVVPLLEDRPPDDDRGHETITSHTPEEPRTTAPRTPSREASPSPSGDPPVDPLSSPSLAPASKVRWKGVVTLPLSINQNSDVGAELDGKRPGQLVGVDDDLRGDYSASAAIMVMSGRAAEAPGEAEDLDRAECERRLPSLPTARNPAWVDVFRSYGPGGTYCMTTTRGTVAAFTVVAAEQPLPPSVTVKVVLWD
ncbi:hypothetical protein ACM614_26280 [Streptomyces sp. 12297]